MKRYICAAAMLAAFSVPGFGQATGEEKPVREKAENQSPCPRIEVKSPMRQMVREGEPVTFVASIAGGDKTVSPTIVWNVSAGSIRDGQGTPKIEVDTAGAGAYREVVAELWLGGYAPECAFEGSARLRVIPPATKADEFGELAADMESDRIDRIASAVRSSNDNIYIFAYAGRTNERGYAANAARRLRDQLVAKGVPAARIGAIDAGFREEPASEFWIVPEGAEPPKPTPTVDRKSIVYPKAPPRKRP